MDTHIYKEGVTVKLLEDKLDEINFSQELMREDFSRRFEDFDETTQARFGMHQQPSEKDACHWG